MPMGSGRRGRGHDGINVWPGFVDALSSLLLVIIFVLVAFVLTQFYLGAVLSGRDQTITHLSKQLNEMTELLDIERKNSAELKTTIGTLTEQLQAANAALDTAKGQLDDEHKLSADAQAQAALLNQQMDAMRQELAKLTAELASSEALSADQKVQIAELGKRLNAALAGKVEELTKFRSEFFGRLRKLLGDKPGIRIEGDRFVFQSELLFPSGSAEPTDEGQARLMELAHTLLQVTKSIPADINWMLRVDGHTDKVPIKSAKFASNWELSTARAVTIVKFLAAQGIPPDRLAAAGFGEFQPIDKGNDPVALAKNRRIEIRLDQR
jgi:chemotaxis protein MotB